MIISSSNDLNQQKDHWKVFGSDYLINNQWSFWLTIEYSKLLLHLNDKIVAWSAIKSLLIIIVNGDNNLCYDIDDYDCQNYLDLDDKMATWSAIKMLITIVTWPSAVT